MIGTSVSGVVLPLVVYQTTGSAAQTGALFALRVVPYLLFGLVAGPVADRGDRRLLIIGGNLVEGTLVATIPIAHLLGVLTIGQIYAVALLSATAFVFSDAAVFGAVPALVGPERLAAANGFLSSLSAGAEIVGPVIAGLLAPRSARPTRSGSTRRASSRAPRSNPPSGRHSASRVTHRRSRNDSAPRSRGRCGSSAARGSSPPCWSPASATRSPSAP
jgi:MFS family permease